MSILIAMIGSDASIVATDSRRIESDGTVRDDARKTFRIRELSIIGGHTGLLEFGGRTVPEWLQSLPLDHEATLDEVASMAAALFEVEMTRIDNSEVGFLNRIANLAFVGRISKSGSGATSIRVIELRPDTVKGTVIAAIKTFSTSCVMGDPKAQRVVSVQLKKGGSQRLPIRRLTKFVKGLVALGIQASGMAPGRSVRSCGGRVQVQSMSHLS